MKTFWTGRRVLVTGHTGFKGSWLSLWLGAMGAEVFGMALAPDSDPNLFDMTDLANHLDHGICDIRDAGAVARRIAGIEPEFVFHLAAQSLVLKSYEAPAGKPATVIVVTTDKVYENREWEHPYRETDRLGGHDMYSSSKAAAELLVQSWRASFASEGLLRLATARAGNVIGGGDYAANRIVPDIVRALTAGDSIEVRSPHSVRPWQHVLEPLAGYLRLAEELHGDTSHARAYNFGPAAGDFRTVEDLVTQALGVWPGASAENWVDVSGGGNRPHEAGLLAVASDLARQKLGWQPRWDFETAIERTVGWYRAVHEGQSPREISLKQIRDYEAQ
jgi:CDP-glucose 4,6-dehydratase